MPRRVLQGRVVSDKGDKTVVVSVERRIMHPVYKKFIRMSKRYAAHDEGNTYSVGDTVVIEECRPLSKRKRWMVVGRLGAGTAKAVVADEPAVAEPPPGDAGGADAAG